MVVSSLQSNKTESKTNLWLPKQVLVTPAAWEEAWGQQIKVVRLR
jgi:spore photoproduct lyase